MPDGTSHAVWEIIKFPLVFIMGILGFNLRNLVSRVDKIEGEHISKEDFNKTVESFRNDMNRGFKNTRDDNKEIHKRIDDILNRRGNSSGS